MMGLLMDFWPVYISSPCWFLLILMDLLVQNEDNGAPVNVFHKKGFVLKKKKNLYIMKTVLTRVVIILQTLKMSKCGEMYTLSPWIFILSPKLLQRFYGYENILLSFLGIFEVFSILVCNTFLWLSFIHLLFHTSHRGTFFSKADHASKQLSIEK